VVKCTFLINSCIKIHAKCYTYAEILTKVAEGYFLPCCICKRGLDDCKAVGLCLSVRLSVVTRMYCDKTNNITPYDSSSFLTRRMVGGGPPLLPEMQTDPVAAKTVIFNRYSLVAPQPLDLAKKSSIITNRKSTTSFPMSLRWTAYVAPNPQVRWPFFLQKCTLEGSLLQSFFVWKLSAAKL